MTLSFITFFFIQFFHPQQYSLLIKFFRLSNNTRDIKTWRNHSVYFGTALKCVSSLLFIVSRVTSKKVKIGNNVVRHVKSLSFTLLFIWCIFLSHHVLFHQSIDFVVSNSLFITKGFLKNSY